MTTTDNIHTDHYNAPHTVVLIFERVNFAAEREAYETDQYRHKNYFKNLGELGKLVFYGEVMNHKAVCAIINVAGACAFETLIANDPALQSGLYQIKQVIPFTGR